MNTRKLNLHPSGITRRDGLLALMGGAAALAGCGGGGGGTASVGSGGTGSFSSGTITGFGSIIVNGVRFDDNTASITDDNGGTPDRSELKLGMVATISGSAVTPGAAGTTPTATASTISFGSELKGPIDSKGTDTFVVLGQTVKLTASTVFGPGITGGFGGLTVGQLVEVHGYLDPVANILTATLVEKQDTANEYKLQGLVKSLNTATKTFNIGTLTISYLNIAAADLPANLANDLLVRVRLNTIPATGTRTATRVRTVKPKVEDRNEAELEGTVTAFTSINSFSVNGIPVNASQASLPADTSGLKLGTKVEVKGSTVNGVLIATRVKLETEAEINNLEFELHGLISALNTTAKTFVVRGVTVKYTDNFSVTNGTLAQLADPTKLVEVRGTNDAATSTLLATRIKFET